MAATPIPINTARLSAADIIANTGATLLGELDEVTGVTTDSRQVRPSSLFVALRGAHHDGHDHIDAAANAGAAGVMIEKSFAERAEVGSNVARFVVEDTLEALGALARAHRRASNARIIAVTGSVGKTSTKDLLAGAFAGLGFRTMATLGNLNNRIGLPMTLLTLTPEDEVAVVELGMNEPGEIAALAEIAEPNVGVVTAVAVVHTAGVGGIAGVAREKVALLEALGEGRVAVYNADDPELAERVKGLAAQTIGFGSSSDATVRLDSCAIDADARRTRASIVIGEQRIELELALLGRPAAENATAALAVVYAIEADRVAEAAVHLGAVLPAPHRMNLIDLPSGALLIDDSYNASPRSMRGALSTSQELAVARGGKLIAVLGDMLELGPDETRLHQEIGRFSVDAGARVLIACGERMSHAGRAALSRTMELPGSERTKVVLLRNVEDAAECVTERLEPSDVVLVKGSQSMGMVRVADTLSEAAA